MASTSAIRKLAEELNRIERKIAPDDAWNQCIARIRDRVASWNGGTLPDRWR